MHSKNNFEQKLGENNVYIRFKSFSGIKNVPCSSNDFQYYFSQPQYYSEDIIIINMFYNTIE